LHRFQLPQHFPGNAACEATLSRNEAARDELPSHDVLAKTGASLLAKEFIMRNRLLALAAIAGALAAPVAVQAQTAITTGVAGGGTVVVGEHEGIVADQRPAFREYVVRERVPNYTISERVIVGGVLPETGVTYYDVPQSFGMTPYRYTVVNGRTILVEPRSRRIVQVVD
jgi:hypothetical protein